MCTHKKARRGDGRAVSKNQTGRQNTASPRPYKQAFNSRFVSEILLRGGEVHSMPDGKGGHTHLVIIKTAKAQKEGCTP
jgi:hypothetical protein